MPAIAIVGEAWGESEEQERAPFVGAAGYELTRMLADAGIHRADCFLTNVFNIHPPKNDVEWFCGPRAEALAGYPYLVKGKYVREEFAPELDRLAQELIDTNPNLVLALGNTAAWALLGTTGITKFRGTISTSTHTVSGFKVLPAYHPAAILRQWEYRHVTVLDFKKAKLEAAYPEIVRPSREIWIEPTLDDLRDFGLRYIHGARRLSVDIETAGTQVTCIGFAPSEKLAIVIPFVDPRRARRSYWPTKADELAAWRVVRDWLLLPIPKTFQNGLYDISFLWRSYRIKVANPEHDTMLLHHALQPESPKSLGFLGSVYTNEPAWKLMREKKTKTLKGDE